MGVVGLESLLLVVREGKGGGIRAVVFDFEEPCNGDPLEVVFFRFVDMRLASQVGNSGTVEGRGGIILG